MSLFDDFMNKGEIESHKSGSTAFGRSAVVAGMILATAFSAQNKAAATELSGHEIGDKYTKEIVAAPGGTLSFDIVSNGAKNDSILEDMIGKALKTPTGRYVLGEVSKNGTSLTLGEAGSNLFGYYSTEDDGIVVNQNINPAFTLSTLVHEGKHSIQERNYESYSNMYYTYESSTMLTRAMEADAMMTETKFSYEMMQQGDSIPWKVMKICNPCMTEAYQNNVDTCGADTNKIMKNTALAWYSDVNYVKNYDKSLIAEYKSAISEEDETTLGQIGIDTHNADSVVTKILNMNGVSYAGTDGSILKTSQTNYLTQDSYNDVCKINSNLLTVSGNCDSSSDNMYVANSNDKILNVTYSDWNNLSKEKIAEYEKIGQEEKSDTNVQNAEFNNEKESVKKVSLNSKLQTMNKMRSKSLQQSLQSVGQEKTQKQSGNNLQQSINKFNNTENSKISNNNTKTGTITISQAKNLMNKDRG
ncbi:MAG: hypothetical protein MJ247_05525 [Alphaproteobacteria bacterium]|nr:hypothetical protein [Alphaproteobacteria bacterium]